jgi:hypothetical protein
MVKNLLDFLPLLFYDQRLVFVGDNTNKGLGDEVCFFRFK